MCFRLRRCSKYMRGRLWELVSVGDVPSKAPQAQESIGRLLRVKPTQDVNGLGSGLKPAFSYVCCVALTFGWVWFNYSNRDDACIVSGWRKMYNSVGNCIRRGCDAAFKGKTLEGKPHECQRHETRSQDSLRSKPLRGWKNLKAERIGLGKPGVGRLKLLRAEGEKNLMRVSCQSDFGFGRSHW